MCDELFWSIFTEKGETPFSMDVLTPKYREIWIEKYVEFLYSCPENSCCNKMTEFMHNHQDCQCKNKLYNFYQYCHSYKYKNLICKDKKNVSYICHFRKKYNPRDSTAFR